MAWTKTKSGGYTKYTQTLAGDAVDTITLAGAGALVITAADVFVSTAGSDGVYAQLLETAAAQEVCIPPGAHLLKLEDDAGGGVVTVYVEGTGTAQSSGVESITGIGVDPS